MKILLLDIEGTALALAMAALIYFFSAPESATYGSWSYIALMLAFIAASVLATKYGNYEKREAGLYEHERSWENVLANGLVPTIAAILSPVIGAGPFICSIAAVTADKFASELGVLSGNPVSIFTLKPVKKGTSGAVSIFGSFMSFDGALVIGAAAFLLFPFQNLWPILLIGAIGFIGGFVDTIFGVLEEKGIGTKATTNILCAITGAVLGYFLL